MQYRIGTMLVCEATYTKIADPIKTVMQSSRARQDDRWKKYEYSYFKKRVL